jgi:hypothetical protein
MSNVLEPHGFFCACLLFFLFCVVIGVPMTQFPERTHIKKNKKKKRRKKQKKMEEGKPT